MKKVAMGLTVGGVAGWFLWNKFQPAPERLTTALAKAKTENRLVLLDFTGSDWCGWCMKLEEESLSKPEFVNYAAKYLEVVIVDFPMRHPLDPGLKQANAALKSKYGVSGFPTLVALSPDGKVVWQQVGFAEGGPFGLIAPLNHARLALGLPDAPASAIAAAPVEPSPKKLALTTPSAAAATPTTRRAPSQTLKLQAIIYSPSNPSVILGGKECEVGESVAGTRVVKIMRDKVVVEKDGQTAELTLH